ncbi:MAG: 3-keto-5-aminohexanoate cleavage protein [Rhodobacteraceae bacterium]|nr:3-keto-5-aminohexanoate cleavage protein [Paracoccaceae bacterium]MCY4196702.1 3-keto-5-aminohexanoate cleavage protein [Paracoccaceae bacterium]MCY4327425.1 3-keto-5-aminohexanoate cleavage protein [Paracoccaceae bacterium]
MEVSSTHKPVIITCAVTGAIHTPTMSPHLPVTPEDIATSAIGAARAGAAILHLHARRPEDGQPDPRPEAFAAFLTNIRDGCDAVVNITTGGGLGMTREERLRAATFASPELASLNMGSINFGLFPLLNKYEAWKHDWEPGYLSNTKDFVFKNTFADIEYILKTLGNGHSTRFEFECYDLGHLHNLAYVADQGWAEPPFFIQLIFGVLGGMGADLDHLIYLQKCLEKLFGDSCEWSVLAAGRHQMRFAEQAALMGGNVRVGLEDSLYIGPGKKAESNAEQVNHIRARIEQLGMRIATPQEARQRLRLKGAKQVSF